MPMSRSGLSSVGEFFCLISSLKWRPLQDAARGKCPLPFPSLPTATAGVSECFVIGEEDETRGLT